MKKTISILALPSIFLLTACAGQVPNDLGVINASELRPCPDKPNCVQTYEPMDESHFQQPLTVKESSEKTKQVISSAIVKTGGQIISEKTLEPSGIYLHAEYESDWFKFVDDVEVLIKNDTIHIRSASRLGYSDLGANAKRFEEIKAAYGE
jgi:uncharacterized protein (DUF1499 family)